jgi:hypothetical protein
MTTTTETRPTKDVLLNSLDSMALRVKEERARIKRYSADFPGHRLELSLVFEQLAALSLSIRTALDSIDPTHVSSSEELALENISRAVKG